MEDAGKRWVAEDLLQSFPLHRACRDGDLGALSALLGDSVLSVCDAVAQDPLFGWTPAHWAAHNGKVDCLQILALAGVPCNISTQGADLTLAHSAALEGQATCLAWLCQNGVCIDAQDHMGETAAHKAVRCGSVECLGVLREHGANFSLLNGSGFTAMDLAVQNQQGQCVDYFNTGGDAGNRAIHSGNGIPFINGSGSRKRSQESEEGMDTSKRARVENAQAQSSCSSLTGYSHERRISIMQKTPELHQEKETRDCEESEAPMDSNASLPTSVNSPPSRRIPRVDHWRYQPFCI